MVWTGNNFYLHLEFTSIAICIVLACFMATKETLRYFDNNDRSVISYKRFADSPQDIYPTFSICISDKSENWYKFFKDDFDYAIPILNGRYYQYGRLLKGMDVYDIQLDIRNISEDYGSIFIMKLEQLYDMINFTTQYKKYDLSLNAESDSNEPFPFYVSYLDPQAVCYTRKDDPKENTIRIEDKIHLKASALKKFNKKETILNIFMHHPGQLLRVFDAPIYQWNFYHVIGGIRKPTLNFKVSQVSILRKRPDSNSPCNPDLYYDDLEFMRQVSKDVGCTPVYWKYIVPAEFKFETCYNAEQYQKVWNILQNFTQTQSNYQQPCNEMKMEVTTGFLRYPDGNLRISVKYQDKTYEEIINEREFGFESLWSTIGGFVGIFVGTSLSQLPKLVTFIWTRLQKLTKQRITI